MQKSEEDAYVKLARLSIETYVTTRQRAQMPKDLPEALTSTQAGVFVSLKKEGRLRGCIGTIGPTQGSIAEEIMENAISAALYDSRFRPVTAAELDKLVYSVDVLTPAHPVDDVSELDAKRYGVIVSKGTKRGLLLPDLEGVDTVKEQIAIAKQKAGIPVDETKVTLERFEVIRHH